MLGMKWSYLITKTTAGGRKIYLQYNILPASIQGKSLAFAINFIY